MTVTSSFPCQCETLTGNDLESCWSDTLQESIPGRGRCRNEELEEGQVLATRTGDSHPGKTGETALKQGVCLTLDYFVACIKLQLERGSISKGKILTQDLVQSHREWRATGRGCARREQAGSLTAGTERPAKGYRCTWFPQSLPSPSPLSPR